MKFLDVNLLIKYPLFRATPVSVVAQNHLLKICKRNISEVRSAGSPTVIFDLSISYYYLFDLAYVYLPCGYYLQDMSSLYKFFKH